METASGKSVVFKSPLSSRRFQSPFPVAISAKKGEPVGSPFPKSVQSHLRYGDRPARRALDLASVHAACTDLDLLDLALDDRAHHLEVRLPGAAGLVVRVRHVVAERDALAAREADISLNRHGLALHQLDARHLGAVTLAVTGLQNARVAAVALGALGPELLEQLVRRLTLVNVANSETTLVQRAFTRLRDQLLDEGTQFLRLGFRGLDRAVLDERRREIPHQRELL